VDEPLIVAQPGSVTIVTVLVWILPGTCGICRDLQHYKTCTRQFVLRNEADFCGYVSNTMQIGLFIPNRKYARVLLVFLELHTTQILTTRIPL
jgi:hypothetical protein